MSGIDARSATRDIQHDLREERWRDDVSRAELLDVNATLAALPPAEREDVLASLSDEELARWGEEMHETSPFGEAGLTRAERGELHTMLARDVGAGQLVRVHDALGVPERRAELVDAVERHATADVREAFVAGTTARALADAQAEGLDRDDVVAFAAAAERLDADALDALVAGTDDAALARLGEELFETRTLGLGDRGLDAAEREALFGALAAKASPESLVRLVAAFGPERGGELVDAIASEASVGTRVGFVQGALDAAPDAGATRADAWTTRHADPARLAAASVLASLRGGAVGDALAGTTAEERIALIGAAGDTRVSVQSYGGTAGYAGTTRTTTFDEATFGELVTALQSVPDADARASLAAESIAALETLHAAHGLGTADRRAAARSVLGALDGATLERLPPAATAPFADALVAGGAGPSPETLAALDGLAPSAARDALVRTVFVKTPAPAFADEPALATAMAPLLAASTGDALDPSERETAEAAIVAELSSERGRALLADARVAPAARLWALEQLMASPAETAALVDGSGPPWESEALVERHARARIEQHAIGRGDQAIEVGGRQIENLIGTSSGALPRADLPEDPDALVARLAGSDYDAYAGNEAVERVAAGVRATLDDWGLDADTDTVGIAAVPIQFSSAASGPIDLVVYRVEGPGGRSAVVDNIGRTYDDVDAWLAENELPPGVVTFPVDLRLGDGATPTALETRVTPNVRDTAWEHVAHWGDVAALALGTVASGVIIFGSGGLATPVVAGAWAVAGGATLWSTARSGADLLDRFEHDQTLSLADPDARAAWLGVAAGGLTLAGGGTAVGARFAANGSRGSVQLARMSGLLGASANYADIAATADQAHALVANWNELDPAARAQMILGIAFWGATTGANARLNGGRVADVAQPNAFELRVQRAAIDTGARVTPNADLPEGTARILRTADGGYAIEHAVGASDSLIAAHADVAQALITNGGIEGSLARFLGAGERYPPNTFGETVLAEVSKHVQLLDTARARAADPTLSPVEQRAARREVADLESDLAYHMADLEILRAHPEEGFRPDADSIDRKLPRNRLIGKGESVPMTDAAQRPFDAVVDPTLRSRYPDAVPVRLEDLTNGVRFTLSDGTETTKTGGHGSTDLRKVLRPTSQNGLGGGVFHDPATDTMIVAVNMRSEANPDMLDRVEVPYTRDAAGVWRADFSHLSAYTTRIDPTLPNDRDLHFETANGNLRRRLAEDAARGDPTLERRLNLNDYERGVVEGEKPSSPKPYTWHHVDGSGEIMLVDAQIHGFFPHYGGINEWGTPP